MSIQFGRHVTSRDYAPINITILFVGINDYVLRHLLVKALYSELVQQSGLSSHVTLASLYWSLRITWSFITCRAKRYVVIITPLTKATLISEIV
jgi:hypothetical protein